MPALVDCKVFLPSIPRTFKMTREEQCYEHAGEDGRDQKDESVAIR